MYCIYIYSLFMLFNGREDGKKESSNLRLETKLRN